jgi:hypothetical protein
MAVRSLELKSIQLATVEVAPDSAKVKTSTGASKPAEDTKPLKFNPEDASKMIRSGAGPTDK